MNGGEEQQSSGFSRTKIEVDRVQFTFLAKDVVQLDANVRIPLIVERNGVQRFPRAMLQLNLLVLIVQEVVGVDRLTVDVKIFDAQRSIAVKDQPVGHHRREVRMDDVEALLSNVMIDVQQQFRVHAVEMHVMPVIIQQEWILADDVDGHVGEEELDVQQSVANGEIDRIALDGQSARTQLQEILLIVLGLGERTNAVREGK